MGKVQTQLAPRLLRGIDTMCISMIPVGFKFNIKEVTSYEVELDRSNRGRRWYLSAGLPSYYKLDNWDNLNCNRGIPLSREVKLPICSYYR